MPNKPILLFPSPSVVERYKKSTPIDKSKWHQPDRPRQIERLEPQMSILETAFDEKRILLHNENSGVEPEMVVVFETRGPVDDFYKALRKIPEMEWLGEMAEDFEADEEFYFDNSAKLINGRVFFIFSNYEAIQQLMSLWNNYYKVGIQFPYTKGKWKDLFDLLHDVRFWGLKDRIEETGLLDDWNYRIKSSQKTIPFEIELWFRKGESRTQSRERIIKLIQEIGGSIIQETIIEEIAYHGILANTPINVFNDITDNSDVKLLRAEDIMFIRPVGQMAIGINEDPTENDEVLTNNDVTLSTDGIPIIALLDGFPLANHDLLKNHLIIDDPDNFESEYPSEKRLHGTSMASLIIHGDLNSITTPLKNKIYVRPIFKYINNSEGIPENILTLDLIHRAVKRLFEGVGAELPVAPNVKIINLSIGDPARIFNTTISSLAKLIDWLSFKYNVLFFVSAGNCVEDLVLGYQRANFQELKVMPNELAKVTVKSMFDNIRLRKIISPAESINSITVGSSNQNEHIQFEPGYRINLIDNHHFTSPYSRLGLGYRRSVKPDFLMPGGMKLYDEKLGTTHELATVRMPNIYRVPPGQKVAAPSKNGTLNSVHFTCGTSNSTALASRLAGQIKENIDDTDELKGKIDEEYVPVLIKSIMTHGASWNPDSFTLLKESLPPDYKSLKNVLSSFWGYGNIHADRILTCTDQRVTLLGWGNLNMEQAHLFKLPLPDAISGKVFWRRLIVTLAWLSPISAINQKYRKSLLWFDFPNENLNRSLKVQRTQTDSYTARRGTIQHEIFEGESATAFIEGSNLEIRVNCREDAAKLNENTRYALSVTLEVSEGIGIEIYAEIEQKIKLQVQVGKQ